MPSDGCLFIGDLSVICMESHLTNLFQDYGRVLRSEIKQGLKAFKFLGYGFITMSTAEEANNAMESLNGVRFLGRKLRINWANNSGNYKEPPCTEVAFSFISKQINHLAYEQTFYDLFSTYGCEVVDVAIKTYKIEEMNNKQHGTGFVHYPLTQQGVLAAKRAVDHLANVVIKDILYDCGLSKNLQDILANRPDLDVPFHSERGDLQEKTKHGHVRVEVPFELPYVTVAEFRHVIAHGEALTAATHSKFASKQQQSIGNQNFYEQTMYQQPSMMSGNGVFPPRPMDQGRCGPGAVVYNRNFNQHQQQLPSYGQYGSHFEPQPEFSSFQQTPSLDIQAQLRFGGNHRRQMSMPPPPPHVITASPLARHPNRHYRDMAAMEPSRSSGHGHYPQSHQEMLHHSDLEIQSAWHQQHQQRQAPYLLGGMDAHSQHLISGSGSPVSKEQHKRHLLQQLAALEALEGDAYLRSGGSARLESGPPQAQYEQRHRGGGAHVNDGPIQQQQLNGNQFGRAPLTSADVYLQTVDGQLGRQHQSQQSHQSRLYRNSFAPTLHSDEFLLDAEGPANRPSTLAMPPYRPVEAGRGGLGVPSRGRTASNHSTQSFVSDLGTDSAHSSGGHSPSLLRGLWGGNGGGGDGLFGPVGESLVSPKRPVPPQQISIGSFESVASDVLGLDHASLFGSSCTTGATNTPIHCAVERQSTLESAGPMPRSQDMHFASGVVDGLSGLSLSAVPEARLLSSRKDWARDSLGLADKGTALTPDDQLDWDSHFAAVVETLSAASGSLSNSGSLC